MELKTEIIDHIIDIEGGYVNDPSDSGGETNWGITVRVARRYGYTGSMRDMPRQVAFDIYAHRYWHSLELDQVAAMVPVIAGELVDTGINAGVGRAAEFLQRSLNALNNNGKLYPDLTVDMDVGPATIRALTAFLKHRGNDGVLVLMAALNALQGAFYIGLAERRPKDEKYLYGWLLNRVVEQWVFLVA